MGHAEMVCAHIIKVHGTLYRAKGQGLVSSFLFKNMFFVFFYIGRVDLTLAKSTFAGVAYIEQCHAFPRVVGPSTTA